MASEKQGTSAFARLAPFLPPAWCAALAALPPDIAARVQEIRLRADGPVTLSLPEGERFLLSGGVTALRQRGVLTCGARQLEACFLRFCEYSVYAHEEELRQGFIAVPGGIRVGVAGTAVQRDGAVHSVRDVTSLCIRLPRMHTGCAAALSEIVAGDGGPRNVLLVGEPSSGKTSLLRDLSVRLAARGARVAVVDERGELSGVAGLPGCDVLRGTPKAEGMLRAVRCLAPQLIVIDELGDGDEARAVAACARAGAAVVGSLHGRSADEIGERPLVRQLVRQRAFDRWIFLAGRASPGTVRAVYTAREDGSGAVCWDDPDRAGGMRAGLDLFPPAVSAGVAARPGGAAAAGAGRTPALYRRAAFEALAAAGRKPGLCGR